MKYQSLEYVWLSHRKMTKVTAIKILTLASINDIFTYHLIYEFYISKYKLLSKI